MPKGKFVFVAIVLLGFLSRVLPHPPNFTPIIGMALLGGAFAARRYVGILLPLGAMLLSDLVLNNTVYASYYEGFAGLSSVTGNGFSYLALAVLALAPALVPVGLRTKWVTLFGMALSGPLAFFLISNFGVWLMGGMYPPTVSGLLACYVAGLAFLPATVYGTLLYGGVAAATLKGFGVSPVRAAGRPVGTIA